MKLKNKVAVITGAGRGIGKAIAEGFAQEGADVALIARTEAELDQTAEAIRTIGRRVLKIVGDVSDSVSVENSVKMVLSEFGQIDILVNNAGRQFPIGPLVENDTKDWIETIMVNLVGTCAMLQGCASWYDRAAAWKYYQSIRRRCNGTPSQLLSLCRLEGSGRALDGDNSRGGKTI